MTVAYDASKGIVETAMQMRSTVFPLVLLKPEFYLLLGLNLTVAFSCRGGYLVPADIHLELSMKLTTVTGSLMTFFVVFYNGNVFTRYQTLYTLTKGMIENCVCIVSIADKEFKDRDLVRKLSRWLLASAFMFFFERTRPEGKLETGQISKKEWLQLTHLGLLEKEEAQYLEQHCNTLEDHAVPSFILLHWSMKIYRQKTSRIPDLDKCYFALRKCQENVVEMIEFPMPFQYFHIMNMMLMLNLCLWAYALGIQESMFAPVIFLFVQLMFQGLRELSIALADPFGEDATDFPLNEWMSGLYVRVFTLCEDEFMINLNPNEPPLRKLTYGHDLLNLHVDKDDGGEVKAKSVPKSGAGKVAKTKPALDGGGDYKIVPIEENRSSFGRSQTKQEDDSEEEEEEDDE